ncbi:MULTISPECIES: SRPBCC family protein [unclassified Mycobacterium]|uniref:SRPBCC family protein n=1 Tax=unclassified Mycobacterium TaxID=2642494 RepID=UPI0007FCAAAF|nr:MULTISPECIES: SRPBCC family protein [unclassified Mycobacterium]OBH30500.1 cyclase [Mycobacterium sp. E1319]
MAVKASREFIVDAPPEKVMGALADVGVLASWSPLHKHMEIIDRYPDGRPHHVRAKVKILGLVDKEILEYHWGPDWMVWDAKGTSQQHGQHVEYTIKPEGLDKSRVRFDLTVEPGRPVPAFVVRRASEHIMDAAVRGLTNLVARGGDAGA